MGQEQAVVILETIETVPLVDGPGVEIHMSETMYEQILAEEGEVAGVGWMSGGEPLNPEPTTPEPDHVAEARADIEETRAHLSETIDAIKDKLSPAHIADEVKDAAIGKAQAAVSSVVDAVKDTAATAVGVAKDAYQSASDKVSDIAHSVADHVHPTNRTYTPRADGFGDANKQNIGVTIVDTIRMNPLPAAIAGFGLGWLLISMQRQPGGAVNQTGGNFYDDVPSDPYVATGYTNGNGTGQQFGTAPNNEAGSGIRDRAADIAHSVSDHASDLAHSVSDKASDMAQSVSGVASDLGGRASDWAGGVRDSAGQWKDKAGDAVYNFAGQTKAQAGAATDSVDRFIHEQPLAAGAIALLIGAAVGYALPSTRKENEILGPQRDRLLDQGKDAAQDVAGKVQSVANVALGQAKESLSRTADQAKQQIQQTVQETRETVVHEAQHQGLTAAAA